MDFETIYAPNPDDDVPYTRPRWLAEDGAHIYTLDRIWRAAACGPFADAHAALEYLQTHLPDFAGQTLRIGGALYQVRPDGLYGMPARGGWTLLEGVRA